MEIPVYTWHKDKKPTRASREGVGGRDGFCGGQAVIGDEKNQIWSP